MYLHGEQKGTDSSNLKKTVIASTDLRLADELAIRSEGLPLDSVDYIFDNHVAQSLKKVVANSCKLVFRFSELDCNTCIDEQFQLLKKFESEIGKNNIISWGSYSNERNLDILLSNNGLKLSSYFTPVSRDSKCLIEKANMPYYFLTDKQGVIRNVFVPLTNEPERTKIYLNEVAVRLMRN